MKNPANPHITVITALMTNNHLKTREQQIRTGQGRLPYLQPASPLCPSNVLIIAAFEQHND